MCGEIGSSGDIAFCLLAVLGSADQLCRPIPCMAQFSMCTYLTEMNCGVLVSFGKANVTNSINNSLT